METYPMLTAEALSCKNALPEVQELTQKMFAEKHHKQVELFFQTLNNFKQLVADTTISEEITLGVFYSLELYPELYQWLREVKVYHEQTPAGTKTQFLWLDLVSDVLDMQNPEPPNYATDSNRVTLQWKYGVYTLGSPIADKALYTPLKLPPRPTAEGGIPQWR